MRHQHGSRQRNKNHRLEKLLPSNFVRIHRSFLVNKNLPFGTRFTELHAEINIAIRINAAIFVEIFFNCSKNLIQKYIFLWLVKTK